MRNRHDEEPIFDDDKLWDELNGDDAERRQAALRVLDALGELASLRAAADRMTYDQAWDDIFDWSLLRWDLEDDGDKPMHEAAWRVWNEVTRLAALRDSKDVVTTEADRRWAKELCAKIHARLAEMSRAAAVETEAGHA